ncbi:FAD-dependent oxidoreductase [Herbaspirillum sp. meg3]|uniref:NAD(P)/FAD-dependent oxidoreductase n=1 Tax=Herbaspirillum sp. meg3 TaxID=2025949 RepID=UPI000B982A6A|nr:NAD(P)/FAD-dependent oxidoreductase [Herbaspirillum sp. meg3]ASU37864.1 FAD-dependent oxidoreductase [Herbaspirillum sp. meg3]
MTERIDCVVIGAGVVGLAIARAFALAGREVVIVEADTSIGNGISSRNSEVIHAGIYYRPGSLKARLCVEGRALLYRYCEERHVAHQRCGKLLVATSPEQAERMQAIAAHAAQNGVHDLTAIDAAHAKELEPALHCVAALLSPSTGIVDSHGLMQQLLADAEAHGAILALQSQVVAARRTGDNITLDVVTTDGDQMQLSAGLVINAGGLAAPRLARCFEGLAPEHIPAAYFAKGNYFSLSGKTPFSRLIYPLPEDGGLGVHLTLDLAGQARFGPDVEWLDVKDDRNLDYAVDLRRSERFYASIRRYWPALPDASLQASYSGVRPKLTSTSKEEDFLISGPAQHGYAGLINLFGIESPGLTSSLAIAQYVLAQSEAA